MNHLDQVVRYLTVGECPEFGPWLAGIEEGIVYFPGTTIRVLSFRSGLSEAGLWVSGSPSGRVPPGMGVYLTLDEYLDLPGIDTSPVGLRMLAEQIVETTPKQAALYALARIGGILESVDGWHDLIAEYVQVLRPEVRKRLENALQFGNPPRHFLVRQVVSQAFSLVMRRGIVSASPKLPPEVFRPIVLCHALAGSYATTANNDQTLIVGETHADQLVLSLLANLQFNSRTNDLSAIARTRKMWTMKSPRAEAVLKNKNQHDVLTQYLGTSIEILLAAALAIYPHDRSSKYRPPIIQPRLQHPRWGEQLSEILDRLAINWNDETARNTDPHSEWDVTFLLDRPLVRINDLQYLLVDSSILMYRLTEGIFQDVINQMPKGSETAKFRSAWGHIIEDYVRERLVAVESRRGFSVYDESDHDSAYPGDGKHRPDLMIDYGEYVLVLEVVSRLFSHSTISEQSVKSFRDDLDGHLFKKVSQLDEAVRPMHSEPLRLFKTNHLKTFIPVLVTADGISNNAVIDALIEGHCRELGLFNFNRCDLPVVLDLDELEMLEARAGRGEFIPDLISGWRASTFRQVPLKNYLIDRFSREPEVLRSKSLQSEFDELTDQIIQLLQDGPTDQTPEG